ncbi:MAG: hypothetical protein ACD_63C00257G0004 [uncultured bacterium]|nr:MAG: hypothetical protein ACD_63C00257G0004 [uncultured bacterium]
MDLEPLKRQLATLRGGSFDKSSLENYKKTYEGQLKVLETQKNQFTVKREQKLGVLRPQIQMSSEKRDQEGQRKFQEQYDEKEKFFKDEIQDVDDGINLLRETLRVIDVGLAKAQEDEERQAKGDQDAPVA